MELRPFQKQALQALQSPAARSVLVIAPTGSGKSLIYELEILRTRFRSLLVTPLIALARQQAQRLRDLGLRVSLTAGGDDPFPQKGVDVWVSSPESLEGPAGRRALSIWKPEFLVVDECHCVFEWGAQFRPSFSLLPPLVEEWRISKSLWLTATLPRVHREELRKKLPDLVELGGFSLPTELSIQILRVPWVVRIEMMLSWIDLRKGVGLIFCATRKFSERVCEILRSRGTRVHVYHAGMSSEERRIVEIDLRQGRVDIVVSTTAFGMGMDFSNLEWVVLLQAPLSLLALAQALGRVSRGGRKGAGLVLWDESDLKLNQWVLAKSASHSTNSLIEVQEFLGRVECRRVGLSRVFDDQDDLEGSSCLKTAPSAKAAPCDCCTMLI